jgi:hypothetical protein
MQKIHLSTTGHNLDGFANIQINPERIDDFIEMPIEPNSVGVLIINGLFKEISLSDSCYILYKTRRWLKNDGALYMSGYGTLGVNFPTVLLRIFYACGFLIGKPLPSQSEIQSGICATKYSCEMPEHLLIQKICRLLNVFDPNNCSYTTMFMNHINKLRMRVNEPI